MPVRTEQYDVVVAGLGAMGGATAAHLASRGARVLGLDLLEPPHAHGSSHGLTRIIREGYFENETYVPLVRRAFALWQELSARTDRELLRVVGSLLLGGEGSRVLAATLASLRAHGVAHEELDSADVRRRFPMVAPEAGTWGIHEPGAAILDVEACVAAHLEVARRAGAELRFQEPVLAWREDRAGLEVRTARTTVRAGALVVAVGAAAPELVPAAPLEVERQVQVWFRPKRPELCRAGALPIFLLHTPEDRMFYGTPDVGDGVKAAFHHGGQTGPIQQLSRSVSAEDTAAVAAEIERFVPPAAGEVRDATVCFYTNTPDGHFLVDRHPEHERVWIVSPCSGHGFKFAPAIGELVATWVQDGRRDDALRAFGLDRLLSKRQ